MRFTTNTRSGGGVMAIDVRQVFTRTSNRYPWDYRCGFNDAPVSVYDRFVQWVEQRELPGIWAGEAFYTNEETAMVIALTWS